MQINAYIKDGTWLRLSNGVEFKVPRRLVKALLSKGTKIVYKYKKSA